MANYTTKPEWEPVIGVPELFERGYPFFFKPVTYAAKRFGVIDLVLERMDSVAAHMVMGMT